MKSLRTTVHLVSGVELTDTAPLDQEVFDDIEIFLKRPVTEDDFTSGMMADVMNEMFTQVSDQGGKLTSLVIGSHFVFVENVAALSFEVVDED